MAKQINFRSFKIRAISFEISSQITSKPDFMLQHEFMPQNQLSK